ncbi:MAG TPA: BRO family protein, partial [Clostridia bacterium]
MSNLQIFKFEDSKEVRTVDRNGEPWFIAKDVANILGYSDTDYAIRAHCKCVNLLKAGESSGLEISNRGMQIIPERDIYRLVMRSKLPSAMKFEEWVVGDVLPSIRKNGNYNGDLLTTAKMFLRMAEEVTDLKDRVVVLEDKVATKLTIADKHGESKNNLVPIIKQPKVEYMTVSEYANSQNIRLGAGKVR